MVRLKGAELQGKMGFGEDLYLFLKFSLKTLPSGKEFSLKEALDGHQEKSNKSYPCRLDNWYERRSFRSLSYRGWGLFSF